jgi:hypothetical protein
MVVRLFFGRRLAGRDLGAGTSEVTARLFLWWAAELSRLSRFKYKNWQLRSGASICGVPLVSGPDPSCLWVY